MTIGYDIDAILQGGGNAYERHYPVYLALSGCFERSELTDEELIIHDANYFRVMLMASGFPRFCEPEYVPEFLASLSAFEKMGSHTLRDFCAAARRILSDEGLIDCDSAPIVDADVDWDKSVEIGEEKFDEFYELVNSEAVDQEILEFTLGVAPKLRFRSSAERIWVWEPDTERGYGGTEIVVENPNPSKSE